MSYDEATRAKLWGQTPFEEDDEKRKAVDAYWQARMKREDQIRATFLETPPARNASETVSGLSASE